MPMVSVIMSIYKEPIEWIKQAIDSILNQTYSNLEFIIVNDCPEREENDRILTEYKRKDSRISLISNETNIGLTKSLNKALDIAKGEYIARMDADDISLPHRFEKQVTYLDNHQDVAVVGSWIMNIDEKGNKIEEAKYETNPRWVRALMLHNSQVCHPASMYRRTINDHVVRYDETIKYAQDYALWASLIPYGEITNISEVLFCYRKSGQQITSSKKTEQEKYAIIIQRRVFKILGFNPTESFLEIFFALTIQQNMNWTMTEVVKEFRCFFKEVHLSKNNLLASEITYHTYLTFLGTKNNNSIIKYITLVLKNSSPFMLFLACKLIVDLAYHKTHR